jgi:hypothetical protein
MCARRFLMVIFVLTLLFVAGAFAIYQWGGRVLVDQSIPEGHFEAAKAGDSPDYRSNDAWLTRPGVEWPDNPVEWKPAGAPLPESGTRRAAVFYIHPTTYLERDKWNAPLRTGGYTDARTRLFLQSQPSAFNDIAEIWAPRYRQAAYGAFLLKTEDAQKALDFAYADVAAAFDEFIRETGDRPIILAAHSQGALHLERLLKEKVAGKPIARRIVAAYVVGWPISTTADLPLLGLPPCTSAAQASCILSWMTFRDPPNPDFILHDWEKTKGLNGGERRQGDALCVNPITGVQNGTAPPQDNPGTLIPGADMQSATLQPGVVGAHCDKGLLILDGMPPQLGSFVLPGNNYHVYDYALFWGAIRRDAERRLAAWHR